MISQDQLKLEFDANVYRIETIKKAAYVYINRFSVNISIREAVILCAVNFPEKTSAETKKELLDDFQKEVLDQDLRDQIADETASYRNAILALAFSSTKLVQDE